TKAAEQVKANEAVVKLFDGIAQLDIPKIKVYCTNDLMILENGVMWNIDSLANAFKRLKNVTFKRINKIDFISTEVRGTTAWVAYYNTADVTVNGQQRTVDWLESAVLVKEANNWKVKLLHSTALAPKNPKN
ncbi:MAG: nuclear transport factor 2 family protein, partial [Chitinophagaceae bacterium]